MMSVEIAGIRELSLDEWDRVGGGVFVNEVAPIVNMINSPSAQLLGLLAGMAGADVQAPQDCSIPGVAGPSLVKLNIDAGRANPEPSTHGT